MINFHFFFEDNRVECFQVMKTIKLSIKDDSFEISTANRWKSSCISWSNSSNIIYRDNHFYRYVRCIVIMWMKTHEQVFLLRVLQSTSCEASQAQDIKKNCLKFHQKTTWIADNLTLQQLWFMLQKDRMLREVARWLR